MKPIKYTDLTRLFLGFSLIFLVPVIQAQELIKLLEAESGTLTLPAKIKTVNGFSGNAYVGDNDTGSSIVFTDVEIEKAGTYEFKTFYTCVGSRSIAVKVNSSSEVISTIVTSTSDWNAPPTGTMSINIYLNQGKNTIKITPHPTGQGGPNMDKFEIWTTDDPQPGEFPLLLEAERARLFGSLKVKPTDGSTISGLSGGKYIGDFNQNSKSYLQFVDVEIPKEGTYELKVYSMGSSRALSIKINRYEKMVIRTKDSPDWNNAPPSMVSTLIYLDKGKNKLTFGTHNDDGPNLDKFEIHETTETIDKPKIVNVAFISDLADDAEIAAQYENETLPYLSDNDEATTYSIPGVTSTQIIAKCKQPILLTGYLLSSGLEGTEDVTKWTVESSVDGSTWKNITPNSTTDLSAGYLFTVNRSYGNAATESAQYYRLTAKGDTDIHVAEWQLFGVPYIVNADGKTFLQDITEGINLETNVTGYPEGASGSNWSEKFYNLFNRKLNSKYYMSGSKQFYVEVRLDKAYTLDAYTLTSADEFPDRDPSRWTLNGFNEESGWIELDRHVEFTFPSRYATMQFNNKDQTPFTRFLLDVETNNGSTDTQLLKWQLFGKEYTGSGIENLLKEGEDKYSIRSEQGKITIISKTDEPSGYQIYNISGVLVNKGTISGTKKDISIPQGLYIVSIGDNTKNYTAKVIVR